MNSKASFAGSHSFKIAGYAHLDGLEPGGVVVGELLEDVSRSEAERTQAMQDGSFEA